MAKLFVLSGSDEGRSYDIRGTIYLGRAPENEVRIRDKYVSRRHLKIALKEGKFFIEDLQSRNGTFIMDKMIDPGKEIEVREGVPIAVGNVYFSLGRPAPNPFEGAAEKDQASLRNLQLIYSVSRMNMQTLNLNQIFEKIIDYVFDLLKRIDRGAILIVDEQTGKISEVVSRSKGAPKNRGPAYSRTIVNKVVHEGKAVMVSDTMRDEAADLSESMEIMKIKSVMCVPLMSRSKVCGAIYVDSVTKPYGFRKEDLSLLTALSSPAAIAIENAKLYADIEKRVDAAQVRLSESEARFKAIFDHMTSGVVVYKAENDGADFTIVDLNKAYEKIEKVKQRSAIGKSYLEVCPHYEGTAVQNCLKRVWQSGRLESGSMTFLDNSETAAWRNYLVYRLPSGEVVAIFDDITERKKAEIEQKALQEKLLFSQKMESIGAFAIGIAHNFRNILQVISGNTEFLEFLCGNKREIAELTAHIYDSVEKGVDLINNLLHFARRGAEGYQMTYLDMGDVIKQTHEIISRVFNKSIDIQLKVENGLYVKGNRSLLSQVLMNLYSNASDAMPNGGRLTVEAFKEVGSVILVVSDTGIGMEEDTLEKIFDPFFTLKEIGRGTGLGLSTVHGILEEHEASISASSAPGQGTTFRISLPYNQPEVVVEETGKDRGIIRGHGEKVLIVDDERPALDALAAAVNKLGYQAVSVEKAKEALDLYSEIAPEVVLMDRGMPGMDGVTCAKKILEKYPAASVIIISGYEEKGPDVIKESRNSFRGYLTKPCRMEELSLMISRALKQRFPDEV